MEREAFFLGVEMIFFLGDFFPTKLTEAVLWLEVDGTGGESLSKHRFRFARSFCEVTSFSEEGKEAARVGWILASLATSLGAPTEDSCHSPTWQNCRSYHRNILPLLVFVRGNDDRLLSRLICLRVFSKRLFNFSNWFLDVIFMSFSSRPLIEASELAPMVGNIVEDSGSLTGAMLKKVKRSRGFFEFNET